MVQRDSFPAEYEALRHDRPLPTPSKIIRFQPFCEHNLIRLGGRLQFAELSHTEKHPILLDGSHHVTHLLIRHAHIQLHHLGVRVLLSHCRHEFWIHRARQNIKKVLRVCLPCKNSEQCSGTGSRGTLTRGTRATFHALCSNRIRLCRSAVYQERHVSQFLHSSPYLRYDESTSSRAFFRHVRRQISHGTGQIC
jgi:hypothetical protein